MLAKHGTLNITTVALRMLVCCCVCLLCTGAAADPLLAPLGCRYCQDPLPCAAVHVHIPGLLCVCQPASAQLHAGLTGAGARRYVMAALLAAGKLVLAWQQAKAASACVTGTHNMVDQARDSTLVYIQYRYIRAVLCVFHCTLRSVSTFSSADWHMWWVPAASVARRVAIP